MRPSIDWSFILSARVVDALADGLRGTITIVLVAGLCAIILGSVIALLQVSAHRTARYAGQTYVALFRNIPLLILLFFFYFGLPALLPRSQFPFIYSNHYETMIAIIAVALVSAAFIAEVIRGSIETISIGQMESALATGLSKRQGFQHVVLPQLGPTALPGLSNEAINIVKNSSFAMTIGVTELIWQAQQIEADTFRGFEAMTAVTIVFLVLNGVIFLTFRALEHILRAK